MKLTRIAQIGAIGAIGALVLAGCAANEMTAAGAPDESATASDLSGEMAGAGASSQEVAVQAWTAGFQTANPDVTITYDPAGSGAGLVRPFGRTATRRAARSRSSAHPRHREPSRR